jgi:tRNA1Val (adenine37-N6)-methyltransferase
MGPVVLPDLRRFLAGTARPKAQSKSPGKAADFTLYGSARLRFSDRGTLTFVIGHPASSVGFSVLNFRSTLCLAGATRRPLAKLESSVGDAARPSFVAARAELERELGEAITLDGLTGSWFIFQRARGHRHSIDDVLTAHYALDLSPPITSHLDLGTGIGTVGLLVAWGMGPSALLVAIEAQAVSHRLLLANVAENGLSKRVHPLLGDLRELALSQRFALITGSPPYFPVSAGIVPQDSQKAYARFELRGDVSDYARAAKRHLAERGLFVFCFPTPQRERALAAVADAELCVVRMRDVIPRASLPALFSLFACRHSGDAVACQVDAPLVVRDADGELSAEMQRVRQSFGFAG